MEDFFQDFGPTISLTTREHLTAKCACLLYQTRVLYPAIMPPGIREVLAEYGAGLTPLLELLQVHMPLSVFCMALLHLETHQHLTHHFGRPGQEDQVATCMPDTIPIRQRHV